MLALPAELGVWDTGWASGPLFTGHAACAMAHVAQVGGWVLVVSPLGSTLSPAATRKIIVSCKWEEGTHGGL